MISFFQFVVITTLKLMKLSITYTLYVLMSLPCMTSSSLTLRLFIVWFRHKYWKFSRTTVWVWLFYFKSLIFLILVFWFWRSNSISDIWYLFLINFTKKKLLYTDSQLLMQYTFFNCHHCRQLASTHSVLCYYSLCLNFPECTTKMSPYLTFFSYLSSSSSSTLS